MLVDFFLHLKSRQLPVSTKELLALLEALEARLVSGSLDDFYLLARTLLVKDEALYDRFDRAFGEYFKGIEALPGFDAMVPEEWLELAARASTCRKPTARLQKLGYEKVLEQLKERLAEQKERHAGGSKWIGTAGTSPSATAATTRKASASAANRSATGRRSRSGTSANSATSTIRSTSACATSRSPAPPAPLRPQGCGDRTRSRRHHRRHRPQRRLARPADAPGTAQRHQGAALPGCRRLDGRPHPGLRGTVLRRPREFKHLEHFYFHNCVYEGVWKDNRRRHGERLSTWDVIHTYGPDYKLIFVGDASMSPYEVGRPGGSVEHWNEEAGAVWLQRLVDTWPRAAWLNPLAEAHWGYTPSIGMIRQVIGERMFPLTLDGLERAMRSLSK
jgi:uncharacterized protein with von Willebrand factor type A (vWA) domain